MTDGNISQLLEAARAELRAVTAKVAARKMELERLNGEIVETQAALGDLKAKFAQRAAQLESIDHALRTL